jgi:MFS family permease
MLALTQGFVMSLGTFIPPFYIQLYGEEHGISKTTSFYALAALNGASMFGRVLPNYLADRVGVVTMYIPCLICASGLAFAMLGVHGTAGLFLFTLFYGVFFGAGKSDHGLISHASD